MAADVIVYLANGTALILRRFPTSTLISCNFDHAHNTPVEFVFSDGESFTLQFEGVWSDLAEFIQPGSSLANASESVK